MNNTSNVILFLATLSPIMLIICAIVFFLLIAWLLFVVYLKGYCLWHAAKREDIWWFVALLIVNTLGILELVYIFAVLKKGKKANTVVTGQKVEQKMEHKTEQKNTTENKNISSDEGSTTV